MVPGMGTDPDHARRRAAQRRGGLEMASQIETEEMSLPAQVDVLAVNEALEKLFTLDSEQAQVVELRFFGGLSIEETASVMDISPATVSVAKVVNSKPRSGSKRSMALIRPR